MVYLLRHRGSREPPHSTPPFSHLVVKEKNMAKKKYTREILELIFQRMKSDFGIYAEEWGDGQTPEGRAVEFKEVCEKIAIFLNDTYGVDVSREAVALQVKWATTPQPKITNIGHLQTHYRNVSIAMEVGFIRPKSLRQMSRGE